MLLRDIFRVVADCWWVNIGLPCRLLFLSKNVNAIGSLYFGSHDLMKCVSRYCDENSTLCPTPTIEPYSLIFVKLSLLQQSKDTF